MQGIHFDSRPDWQNLTKNLGFNVALLENPPYWAEALDRPFAIEFSLSEIQAIAAATAEINGMALALVEHVCQSNHSQILMDKLQIPPAFRDAIRLSWRRQDPTLYGRLDLSVNGTRIKLLELNYDTPACLPEAAVLQLDWYAAMLSAGLIAQESDQFNFIQENLLPAFAPGLWPDRSLIHFAAYQNAHEDVETVKYLYGLAQLAGLSARLIVLNELKRSADGNMHDADGQIVSNLYKLYPWERIFLDEERLAQAEKSLFLPLLLNHQVRFLEPVWKTLVSSKACLPLLWDMFPDHPLLLESYFESDSRSAALKQKAHVRKATFGWEGANIEIIFPDDQARSELSAGEFTEQGFIVQAYEELPVFDNYHLVVGSWLANNRAVGMGIRADQSKITGARALFIPHYVA